MVNLVIAYISLITFLIERRLEIDHLGQYFYPLCISCKNLQFIIIFLYSLNRFLLSHGVPPAQRVIPPSAYQLHVVIHLYPAVECRHRGHDCHRPLPHLFHL